MLKIRLRCLRYFFLKKGFKKEERKLPSKTKKRKNYVLPFPIGRGAQGSGGAKKEKHQ
jgi:hypothetical protein